MAQDSAPCTIRAPVPLQVGDGKSELGHPGVYVIDVALPKPQTINEISFKNFYTAFLTVRIQQRKHSAHKNKKWRTCIRNLRLMVNPHTEDGSQDYVSLHKHQAAVDLWMETANQRINQEQRGPSAAESIMQEAEAEHSEYDSEVDHPTYGMLCATDHVSSMRLILRQPSPVWTSFTVEDLQINPPGRQSLQKGFSWWLNHLPPKEQLRSLNKGLPNPDRVSSELQQMWMLTEVMRSNQSSASVGRFDVDGCYDINLLSYT